MINIIREHLWKPVMLQVGNLYYRGTITEIIFNDCIIKLQHKFYPELSNNKICTYFIDIKSIVCISELIMPQDQDIIIKSINN